MEFFLYIFLQYTCYWHLNLLFTTYYMEFHLYLISFS